MTRWAESLIDLPPAGTLLLKATLLLALGWMLYAVLLRANPRWRVLLWRGILVGLLALPVAELVLPELDVAIRREAVNAEPVPLTAQPFEISIPNAIPSGVLEGDLVLPAEPRVQQQVIRLSILTWAKEHLKVLLFSCWALVSAVLLLRLTMTANRVRRAVRQAEPAPEQVLRAAERVAKDIGCRAAVDVRVMNNLASPFLIGHWRPVVVVPARMTGDDQAKEWPAIFAHELAHHMSKDILWLPLTTIAAALLWFHPLAWRMCAAQRRACEEVSDAVAADYIGDNRAYSQTLARSALAMTDHMQAPGGLPMIRTANIARRLAKIRKGIRATMPPRKQLLPFFVLGMLGLAVLGSLRLVQSINDPAESAIENDLVFPPAEPGKPLPPIDVEVNGDNLTVELPGLDVTLLAIISPEGEVRAPDGTAYDTSQIDSHIIESFRGEYVDTDLPAVWRHAGGFGIMLRLRYTQGFEGEKDIYKTRIEHAQYGPSQIGLRSTSWSRAAPRDFYTLLELSLRDGQTIETGFDLVTDISYGPPFLEQVEIDPNAKDTLYEFVLADFVATVENLPETDPEETPPLYERANVVLRFTRSEPLSNFEVRARFKDGKLVDSMNRHALDDNPPRHMDEPIEWSFGLPTPISKASVESFVFMGHRIQPIRWKGVRLAAESGPSTAKPELENSFSAITDPSELGALRDEAIANGDVIRACDAEMQRVKARGPSGSTYRDKIDLVSIYRGFSERPEGLSLDEVEEILIELEAYEAAHAADPDYAWRVWHLCSVFTRGHDERSIAYMERSISAYPRVKYAIPSKHSKFQHLVNEMAMILWDREGVETAEDYVVEMWETDRRFVHFFDHPWQQRYESAVGGDERLERLRARMLEKVQPPLERITLILTPEGIRYRDEFVDWATLEKALGEIANPYDHFLALGITTEDLSLKAWREAQARCINLVKKLGFDHFSDIGLQQEEERTAYVFGDGLSLRTQDGEQLVETRAIAIRANGLPVAAGVTDLANLVLLEFDGERWSLATPFIDHVTKTPQHDEVASRSGKTYFSNKGAVVAKRHFDAKGYSLTATKRAVWERRVADPSFETKALFEVNDETIRALAAIESGAVAIGTSDGLYLRSDDEAPFEQVFPTDQRYSWSPRNVAALAYDTRERLWFGCDQGAGVFDGESWTLFTGEEGLPYRHFTCAAPGEDGVIWFGTERGAIRFDGSRWAYHASLRWLPDDYVYDIAVGPAGDAWIATKEGISRITRQ